MQGYQTGYVVAVLMGQANALDEGSDAPINSRRRAVSRPLRPASIKIRVVADFTKMQLPELPLANTQTFIKTVPGDRKEFAREPRERNANLI